MGPEIVVEAVAIGDNGVETVVCSGKLHHHEGPLSGVGSHGVPPRTWECPTFTVMAPWVSTCTHLITAGLGWNDCIRVQTACQGRVRRAGSPPAWALVPFRVTQPSFCIYATF